MWSGPGGATTEDSRRISFGDHLKSSLARRSVEHPWPTVVTTDLTSPQVTERRVPGTACSRSPLSTHCLLAGRSSTDTPLPLQTEDEPGSPYYYYDGSGIDSVALAEEDEQQATAPGRISWRPHASPHAVLTPKPRRRREPSLPGRPRRVSEIDACHHFCAEEIGNLDMVGFLGSGQFSDVYSAIRVADNRPCAVKRTKRQIDAAAALDEISALRDLGTHVNIVAFLGAFQEDGHLHLVLELLVGSVEQIASSRPLPDPPLWTYASDVAAALAHVHARGYAHLDVKPANVLVDQAGVLKLADFGLATKLGLSPRQEGDAKYLAPELLQGYPVASTNDIFSLAISIYQLHTTGVLPDQGPLWHALRNDSNRLLASTDNANSPLVDLINNAMAARSHLRPTARQIAAIALGFLSYPSPWLEFFDLPCEIAHRPTPEGLPVFPNKLDAKTQADKAASCHCTLSPSGPAFLASASA